MNRRTRGPSAVLFVLFALVAGWGLASVNGQAPLALAETSSVGPCPPLMARVEGRFCIDRYEAALERQGPDGSWGPAQRALRVGDRPVRAVPARGVQPFGHVSAAGGELACANAGKRLCTSEEWLQACRGPEGTQWPYGSEYRPDACNDEYPGRHPVIDLFDTAEGVWDPEHMNSPSLNQQPDTVDPGGAHPACVSAYGVYDMHGNLHEWVSDAGGVFRGGFYADAERNGVGCEYATTAHGPRYRDYSTGFRCCADLPPPPPVGTPAPPRSARPTVGCGVTS